MLITLGEQNIKLLKDFADLASDELIGGYNDLQKWALRDAGD